MNDVLETFQGTTQRQYLYAAMTCDVDHDHRADEYASCVPDTVVLGEN